VLAAFVIFVILCLIFGIGGAIEISLWFLLLVALAIVLGVVALRRLVAGGAPRRR
jgi:hypothetical protein